ncbi:TPA: hypothetical protein ACVU5P_004174 [Vibrio parahaemolyticus]
MSNEVLPCAGIYSLKGETISHCPDTGVWFFQGELTDVPTYCEARTATHIAYRAVQELAGHIDQVKETLFRMKDEGKSVEAACAYLFKSKS